MTYILKSKYIFSAWFNHTKDYSVQTLYQSSERLVEIYKTLNFDYQQQAGIQASIPFKVKDWLNSRLTPSACGIAKRMVISGIFLSIESNAMALPR